MKAPLARTAIFAKLIGVALVLAVLASSLALIFTRHSWVGSAADLRFAIARDWAVALVLVAIVLYWERLPLSSLGLYRPAWRDLFLGIGGFVAGILAFGISGVLVHALHLGNTVAGIHALARIPLSYRTALILTAGITEEIMFRGYLLERAASLTRSIALGAVISLIVFGLGHISGWGIGGALQITLWTIVITGLYVATRRLLPCIVMHMLNDAFAFIIVPALMLHK